MINIYDEDIKKIFKILIFVDVFFILFAIILNVFKLYFLSLGITISIISNYMIYLSAYKIVYMKSNKGAIYIGYAKRYILYSIALCLVYYLSKKYFKDEILINMLLTFIGLITMSSFLILYNLIKNVIERRR